MKRDVHLQIHAGELKVLVNEPQARETDEQAIRS
jgi:hypothetical protein